MTMLTESKSVPDELPNDEANQAETAETTDEGATLTKEERAELTELRREWDYMEELALQHQRCELRVEGLKEELKDAKEDEKRAGRAIQRELLARRNDANRPLLKLADHDSQSIDNTGEAWRAISIDELGLPAKVCEALREHSPSLDTVGAIGDWTGQCDAAGRYNQLTDVKGIGAAKATQIDEALDRVWKQRKEQQASAPPEPLQEWETGGDPLGCDEEDEE